MNSSKEEEMHLILTALLTMAPLMAAPQPLDVKHDRPVGTIRWETNFEKAEAMAKQQNKPMFLFFTGSDWCKYCKMLDKEVLGTSEFAQLMGDKFVFVEFDFPGNKKLPADLVAQNKKMQERFRVRGYPTAIILSPQGKQLGETGYQSGGPQKYAEMLNKMLKS